MNGNLKLKEAKEKSINVLTEVLEELDYEFNVSGNPFRLSHAESSNKANLLNNRIIKAIQLIDNVEL